MTIPKEVRQALGVEPGDRVNFVLRPDGVVELVARSGSVMELAGALGERRFGVTLDDMDATIGEAAARALADAEP